MTFPSQSLGFESGRQRFNYNQRFNCKENLVKKLPSFISSRLANLLFSFEMGLISNRSLNAGLGLHVQHCEMRLDLA